MIKLNLGKIFAIILSVKSHSSTGKFTVALGMLIYIGYSSVTAGMVFLAPIIGVTGVLCRIYS